jgi:ABC-type nitrate/sulfonate/bicarbonate transport system substrate-binding protein
VGANIASLVVSGQSDIGNLGVSGIIAIAKQGKPTTAIWGSLGNGFAGMFFVGKDHTSVDTIKKGNCKIGANGVGTSNYGWASYYNNYFGLNCKIIVFSSPDEQVGALATGQTDASSGFADAMAQLVAKGQARIIVDSRDPAQRKKFMGDSFTDVVFWGLSDWIKAHPEIVRRFVKAMWMTDQYLHSHKPAEMAAVLHKNSSFATTSLEILTAAFQNDKDYWNGINHGYLGRTDWGVALKAINGWGVKNWDANAPEAQYEARVDMSFYEKVAGKPKNV